MGDRMSSSLIGRTNKKRIPIGYPLFISSNGQLRLEGRDPGRGQIAPVTRFERPEVTDLHTRSSESVRSQGIRFLLVQTAN